MRSRNRIPRVAVNVTRREAKVARVAAFLSRASVLSASEAASRQVVSSSASTVSGLGVGAVAIASIVRTTPDLSAPKPVTIQCRSRLEGESREAMERGDSGVSEEAIHWRLYNFGLAERPA